MRQKHIHIIMMNSEEEFGINQFVDLSKNKLDLIVHKKEKQSWNKKRRWLRIHYCVCLP